MAPLSRDGLRASRLACAKIVLALALLELLLMVLLPLAFHRRTTLYVADALLVALFVAPLLYVWVVREARIKEIEVRTLRERSDRLRVQAKLLDMAHILVRGLDGRILLWNAGAEQLYGWNRQEAVGKVSFELLETAFPEPMDDIDAALLSEGRWEGELVHRAKDGRRLTVASHWTLHRDEQGRPTAVLEVNNDITERKQAEDALRKASAELELRVQERTAELRQAYESLSLREQELRTLAEHSPDIISRTGPDLRILYASPSFRRATGKPADDVVGKTRSEAGLRPRTVATIEAEIRRVFATGQESHFEFEETATGETIFFDSIARPEFASDGTVASVLVVSRDITARKRVEDEVRLLQAVTQTIAEASDFPGALEGILRAICLSTGWTLGEIWTPSPDGSRLQFGAAWTGSGERLKEFLEISRPMTFEPGSGLPGMAWRDRRPVWFEDVQADHEFRRVEAASRSGLRGALALPVFAGDALVLVMDFLVPEAKDWSREPRVGIVQTAAVQMGSFILRRKAEDERERLRQEFLQAQRMEAIGRLAGGVAHDFANILSAVVGTSELILSDLNPSDRHYADLRLIKESSLHGVALIKQLLALSRGKSAGPGVWKLDPIVRGLEQMLRRVLGDDIRLELRLSDGRWAINSDRGQLEQVVMNLAVNARDAMPQGGRLFLEVTETSFDPRAASRAGLLPGDYVVLSVSDTGVGMTPEVKARVFEPFFTTKSGSGTGLGLATVRHIVAQAGGKIFVESEPGQGATFRLFFPRAQPQPERGAEPPRRELDWRRGSETILLVEDDTVVRAVARQILLRAGYKVLEAGGAEEALGVAREHRGELQLLLTDVQLPEMDGFALARAVAELRPGVPVAYVSGYSDRPLMARVRASGPGAGFIPKPFTMESLLKAVRRALGPARVEAGR